jgi:hypothetical protein
MSKLNQDSRPLGSPQSWAKTPGTYIAAQAHIDGLDDLARQMELKWGAGRLRLLVSPELREKFDRQRYLFNQAIWHGDLVAVRVQSQRMASAWTALDGAAVAAGASKLSGAILGEVVLASGTVAVLVASEADVAAAADTFAGRRVAVYALAEIGRMLDYYNDTVETKLVFPGAIVTAVRTPSDPLDALADTAADLDDPLDQPLPLLGS